MSDLQKLLDKRAKLIKEWRNFLEQHDEKGLSAEAKEKSDKMYNDINALDAQIEALRKAAELEAKLNKPLKEPLTKEPVAKSVNSTDYKMAFEAYVRGELSADFKAVLNTGVGSEGGYIVPQEYQNKILQKLTELSRTRSISTVISTKSTRNIPIGGELPEFSWVDENGVYGEVETNFDNKQLGAHKLGGIIKVSEELLQDAMINLEEYLSNLIARGLAKAEGSAFAKGDGNAKPTGYMNLDATKTLSSKDSIAADELIDIFYSLKSPYRENAIWRMNDQTLKAIRKIKDSNGQYIYAPALVMGERDAILGRPIELDPFVDTLGAGNKVICFGDFSYYYIADRGNIEIQKLVEAFAVNGQIGFKIKKRVDAKPILTEAFTIAKNADS